ncbi:MAG: ABC transporter substrate binding protein, partial [Leptotrichiaceae bacterium]
AIYLPTDNLVASTIKLIADKTNTAKKILFSAEPGMVEGGALMTQGVDYYEIGKAAGKLAIEILKNGKKPADLPFQTVPLTDIVINQKTLGILGITIPEDIKSKARMVGK